MITTIGGTMIRIITTMMGTTTTGMILTMGTTTPGIILTMGTTTGMMVTIITTMVPMTTRKTITGGDTMMGTTGGTRTGSGWQKRRMTKGNRTCGMTFRKCIMTTTMTTTVIGTTGIVRLRLRL